MYLPGIDLETHCSSQVWLMTNWFWQIDRKNNWKIKGTWYQASETGVSRRGRGRTHTTWDQLPITLLHWHNSNKNLGALKGQCLTFLYYEFCRLMCTPNVLITTYILTDKGEKEERRGRSNAFFSWMNKHWINLAPVLLPCGVVCFICSSSRLERPLVSSGHL